MLIKFGAIVTDGIGKLGGHVLTRSRAGKVMATKSQPRNPATLQQHNSRYYTTLLSQAWQELTDEKRQTWNDYALGLNEYNVFGDLKNLSGFSAYIQCNFGMLLQGLPVIDEAPVISSETLLSNVELIPAIGSSEIKVSFDPSPLPADTTLVVRMSRPVSKGISNFSGSFKNLLVIPAGTASPVNIYDEYVAAFGYAPVGARVFGELTQMSKKNGRKKIKFKPGADLKV